MRMVKLLIFDTQQTIHTQSADTRIRATVQQQFQKWWRAAEHKSNTVTPRAAHSPKHKRYIEHRRTRRSHVGCGKRYTAPRLCLYTPRNRQPKSAGGTGPLLLFVSSLPSATRGWKLIALRAQHKRRSETRTTWDRLGTGASARVRNMLAYCTQ